MIVGIMEYLFTQRQPLSRVSIQNTTYSVDRAHVLINYSVRGDWSASTWAVGFMTSA